MCGICGILNYPDDSYPELIRRMTELLKHRGPDDWGVKNFPDDRVALGHTRLSILDLSPKGHQPMCNDSGKLWITYNGEIYNYREIRGELTGKDYKFSSNTDTEVILYSYKEWGTKCLDKFNGMFAFAIWDDDKKVLFAARDRIGIKPFYYFQKGKFFVFASEIKAILASSFVDKEVDYHALHTPAMYQASPFTGFKGIYKLEPGCYLLVDNQGLKINKYWKINPIENGVDERKSRDELDDLLNESVTRQMISDVPVGAFLSGGLDSSLIVALMHKNTKERVTTFTIRYSKHDQNYEQMPDDSKYARKVAEIFGCRHYEFEIKPDITNLLPKMIWHLDEPLADPASINTYLIAKSARENGIVVLLNGMGGDEIFGGYRKQLACLMSDWYQSYIPEFAQFLLKKLTDRLPVVLGSQGIRTIRWTKRFMSFATLPQAQRYFASGIIDARDFRSLFSGTILDNGNLWTTHYVQSQKSTLERKDISYLTRICLTDTQGFLPDHNLTYSDKCCMAEGVESRPPLTDHEIVEFMFTLRPAFRIKGVTQKYLLKKVAERYLPKEIVYRPKAPFGAPLRSWIRGALSEMIGDYLSPTSLKQRGVYNPEFVWKKIENDKNGLEDNAHLIWTLLCNEIWFRTFFNK
jgi:asparagine synthase (glutamine-hydrolysing)